MKLLFIVILVLTACSRPTEIKVQRTDAVVNGLTSEPAIEQIDRREKLPDFAINFNLPDSLFIDVDKVLTGDFNADGKEDFASLVTNLKNNLRGVLVIHNNSSREYFVFGAQEVNKMKNLDWIGDFKTIKKEKQSHQQRLTRKLGRSLDQIKQKNSDSKEMESLCMLMKPEVVEFFFGLVTNTYGIILSDGHAASA